MEKLKNSVFAYLVLLLIFGAAIYAVMNWGAGQFGTNTDPAVLSNGSSTPLAERVIRDFQTQLKDTHTIFLIQIIVIFAFARLMGWVATKFDQPAVIGEILAGILLGHSFLGLIWPDFYHALFPPESLKTIKLMSHVGVLIFMFMIGLEFDLKALKSRLQSALLISHVGILFPFFLGALVAIFLYPRFVGADISFLTFALFMGIAMSITAFPVLARILQEKKLMDTDFGMIALTAASIDDVTAWTLLAFIIAAAHTGSFSGAFATLVLLAVYILIMFFVVRPIMGVLFRKTGSKAASLSLMLVYVFISALMTQIIGVHALFGAFFAGILMPHDQGLREFLSEKINFFCSAFLLPLFFAVTGIRTKLEILAGHEAMIATALIIVAAIMGKWGGTFVMGRYLGMGWRSAFSLGALMNTRGLMELIVLNLAYEMGVFSDTIFAMMVLMALLTTFIAGPALSLAQNKPALSK